MGEHRSGHAAMAAELGGNLIAASALPTGASARNLIRYGFELTYTQTVFVRG